ncbi:MAG: probable thiamine biosynthesis protein [Leptospirillum rubarum]|jgi:hypothetical protein|nr:MAG: probable thiamine biosynthesis protein [Leptospirillum rubarum]
MKGLLLLSGGLDSSLAGKLLLEQGVELVALHLESPFGCDTSAADMADELRIPLIRRPKGDRFVEILKHPAHGYGSVKNPCVDCRILMFTLGREVMKETGAGFLVTGEVVGQRPLSQKKQAMTLIDRESAMEGVVVRPLSARLLPETDPEKRGWIDRKRLLSLSGRSRKPQLALARTYGFSRIPSPAGGCLLTDDNFRERLDDFVRFDEPPAVAPLLRFGRHYRFDDIRVIVGRDVADNARLDRLIGQLGMGFHPSGFNGPGVFFPDPLPPNMEEIATGALHVFAKNIPEDPLPLDAVHGEDRYRVLLSSPSEDSPWRDPEHWRAHWRH